MVDADWESLVCMTQTGATRARAGGFSIYHGDVPERV